MKNLYPLVLVSFLAILSQSVHAQAPVHVQTKSAVLNSSSSSISVTMTNPSSAHNLIIVHITWDKQNRDVTSVTDTKNTYTVVPGSTVNFGQGSNKYRSALYYAYNISVTPGALTIKATLDNNTNSFSEIYASEYSNVLTTSDPLDMTSTVASNTTPVSSGTVSTTAGNELIYGVGIGATDAVSAGAGFNVRSTAQSNIVEDKSGGSAGSYSATFSVNNYYLATVATFKSLTTLPVNLISFDAQLLQDNKVQLNWATGQESNSDHFEVEHSRNGLDWVEIGRIDAAGNSTATKQYSFVDDAPSAGVNYYRLKQVDLDGQSTISKTLTVHTAQQAITVKLYPNPATSYLTVEGSAQSIAVFNMAGQQMPVRVNQQSDTKVTLDLSSLPTGNYFLRSGGQSTLFRRQ